MTEEREIRIEDKIDKVFDELRSINQDMGKHGADIDNLKKAHNRSWTFAISILISLGTMFYASVTK